MKCRQCGGCGHYQWVRCPECKGSGEEGGEAVAFPPPCIHGDGSNLCASCQACYDEDPSAYLEYGDHPAGLERWRAEKARIDAELARDAAKPQPREDEIPF